MLNRRQLLTHAAVAGGAYLFGEYWRHRERCKAMEPNPTAPNLFRDGTRIAWADQNPGDRIVAWVPVPDTADLTGRPDRIPVEWTVKELVGDRVEMSRFTHDRADKWGVPLAITGATITSHTEFRCDVVDFHPDGSPKTYLCRAWFRRFPLPTKDTL